VKTALKPTQDRVDGRDRGFLRDPTSKNVQQSRCRRKPLSLAPEMYMQNEMAQPLAASVNTAGG